MLAIVVTGSRIGFNSSMVRLKGVLLSAYVYVENKFQFQYGAIKGHPDDAYFHDLKSSFNSSMVRLKAWVGANGSVVQITVSIPVWCD